MLLDETKHVEPGLINIGCRGGGGSLTMCDIEDVVRKITPVFNILNPFCPRLSGDHFAQEHETRVCMSFVSTKKKIYQS